MEKVKVAIPQNWDEGGKPDIQAESDYYVLCHIARLINEGFYSDGGRIRGVPVRIGGTNYVPPLPIEIDVKDRIQSILHSAQDEIAIPLLKSFL